VLRINRRATRLVVNAVLWQSICTRSDSKDSRGDERHLQGGDVLGKSLESGIHETQGITVRVS
jgi:hypothetical protein